MATTPTLKWLSLDDIKDQCRIEPEFTLEDDLLKKYGKSAEDIILQMINNTYHGLLEQYGEVPQNIVHVSLMLVDEWYMHRSPVENLSISSVPYTFDLLLKPYMHLAGYVGEGAQNVTIGSDEKIGFSANLPDGLKMRDVDFYVTVYNADKKDAEIEVNKSHCIMINDNEYAVLVDTEELGVGLVLLKVTFKIPDTDYQSGFRKQVVKINPKLIITG